MKKYLLVFSVLGLWALIFASCGKMFIDSDTYILRNVENISDFVIVKRNSSSISETLLAADLRSEINDITGTSISVKTEDSKNQYEILLGKTSRKESIDETTELRYSDYTIKRKGDKIIVAGGSEEALKNAIEHFKEYYIDKEKKCVKIPIDDGYTYRGSYSFDSLKVDGVDISEFSIFYSGELLLDENGNFLYGTYIRQKFGVDMPLVKDNLLEDSHYIIIDNTGVIADEYSIDIIDGNIHLKGSCNTIDDAIEYLVGDFFGGNKNIKLKSGSIGTVMSIGKKEMYTKDQLLSVLNDVYNNDNACIIGQQCNHGTVDMVARTVSDFESSTGQKPGIIGIDLGVYGVKLHKLTDELKSQLICEIVDYCGDGGIITSSAHWTNPSDTSQNVRGNLDVTNSTKEEYEEDFRQVITEGTEYNKVFMRDVNAGAELFGYLQDNGVVCIWRPFHEMNGYWFWYCVTQEDITVDASCIVDMWKYLYNYYVNECNLNNLIWCYGPNYSGNVENVPGSTMSPMYCYPGDEYVDMVGVDWYTAADLEITKGDNYLQLVNETGKIGAITEFGPGSSVKGIYDTNELLMNLWTLKEMGYKFTYLLTWHSAGLQTVGAMGGETGGYDFMNEEYTLSQADVKAMLDKIK